MKDAYLHVPIASEHRRFLRFWWRGNKFQFRRLPFGLSSAPRTFTRLTSSLRSQQGRTHSSHSIRLGHSEESRIPEKSQEMSSGTQTIARVGYLGLLWNSKELRVFLPHEKLDDFKRLGRTLLSNPSLALAQKFLGKAVFARRAVQLGRLLLRPLHMAVIQALRSGELILDNESRLSIRWWTRPPTDGMDLRSYTPQPSMTTDASNSGWGATLDDRSASGRWSTAERDLHINHLELLAVFRGVKSFRRHLRNRRVTVHLDNITATAHLSKEGGTRSTHLNKLTMEILLFCKNHGVVLTPAYLPGIANLGADALSRGKETSEWFINPIVTRRMFRRFGHPQIDLFASNRSAQVETYFSLDRRDKLSAGTNALNQTWAFNLMYAFPPPQTIPDTGQDERVQGDIDSSHPLLVQGSLVTRTPADVSSGASTPSSASEYGERPDHRQEPAIFAEAQADSMAYLRNTFQSQGTDHTLAEFICGSWSNTPALGGHDQNGAGDTLYQELLQL